jgi:hypothetical protein
MGVSLHTMVAPQRGITLPSGTNDGGEIMVPFLTWGPDGEWPCEMMLLDPAADDNTTRIRCGRPRGAEIHEPLEDGPHHDYLATSVQPGFWLTLDNRFGLQIPTGVTQAEAEAIVEFVANAIAIGAGYPSIYYTKRKMPFRG